MFPCNEGRPLLKGDLSQHDQSLRSDIRGPIWCNLLRQGVFKKAGQGVTPIGGPDINSVHPTSGGGGGGLVKS